MEENTHLYTVYLHRFPNKKVYIGITQQEVARRWLNGYGYRKNILMWHAICKYGWNNIEHEILFEGLSEDEANKKEIELITAYNSADSRFGYNIRSGGLVCTGWHHTDEALAKMSEASKRPKTKPSTKIGRHYGRTKIYQYSVDTGVLLNTFIGFWEAGQALGIPRDNISDCANGHSKSCYGYHFSKELLQPEEVLAKLVYKPTRELATIYQYDKNCTLLNIAITYKQAVEQSGVKESTIESCCMGRIKTAKGYVFSLRELSTHEILAHYKKDTKKLNYKIYVYSKSGEFLDVYYSITQICEAFKTSSAVIYKALEGKSRKLSKYIFKKESLDESKSL